MQDNIRILIESVAEISASVAKLQKEIEILKRIVAQSNADVLKSKSELANLKSKDFMTVGDFYAQMSERS